MRGEPPNTVEGLKGVQLNDETLRDGIQSPSVRHPTLSQKLEALECMVELGVDAVSLGLPAAGARAEREVGFLFQRVIQANLPIHAHCAGRTTVSDLEPIARIQQRVGQSLTAYAFLGTSPIRRFAEGWPEDRPLRILDRALSFASREGVDVAFVTEDTTRTPPNEIRRLFRHAAEWGVRRIVLCDTVGFATPSGTRRLLKFAHALDLGDVRFDWHGHDDRGLALANALAAASAGAHRIHGTLFGLGERSGNTALEYLLRTRDPKLPMGSLDAYQSLIARAFGWAHDGACRTRAA